MKKLFFLFVFLCAMYACQSQQVEKKETPQAVTAAVKAPVKEAKFTVPPHFRGSIPKAALPIATDYPYHIDLTNADGESFNSSTVFKKNGKPTVLLFWLTTCYPCGLELKALKEKYPTWAAAVDFNFYAVSTDFQKNYANFQKRVKTSGWAFETYHDTNRVFAKAIPGNLNGLPQVFVYDADGNIVYHKRKYRPGDEDKLFDQIKAMVSEN